MTKKERTLKRANLRLIKMLPHEMWQCSLNAIGIPSDVVSTAIEYDTLDGVDTYLDNSVPERRSRWAHREAEANAIRAARARVLREHASSAFRRFGVEIECYNADRAAILTSVRAQQLEITSETYNHTDGAVFKIVSDSSLTGANTNEVVTPPLNDFESLQRLLCGLNNAGARVNVSCGLHIHIDAIELTPDDCAAVVNNYYRMRSIINAAVSPSRRNNTYCRVEPMAPSISEYQRSRYKAVNLCALSRHGTIEFRQHQGSLNFEKIKNWVVFLQNLVNWSQSHYLVADVTGRNDGVLEGLDLSTLRIF